MQVRGICERHRCADGPNPYFTGIKNVDTHLWRAAAV
jgi:hypothetical protein